MQNTNMQSFQEKLRDYQEQLEFKSKKYNRSKAAKMVGFSNKRGAFTEFLKANYILDIEDFPNQYLIEKKFMTYADKSIYERPIFDDCGIPTNHDERIGTRLIKRVYTPLFTESGIIYLKKVLENSGFLESEKMILQINLLPRLSI